MHALNIIRDLYRDSLLAEDVAPFIARGMKTAIRGFSSNSWAVSSTEILSCRTLRVLLGSKFVHAALQFSYFSNFWSGSLKI